MRAPKKMFETAAVRYIPRMRSTLAPIGFSFCLLIAGCATGPPKQEALPEIEDEGGLDPGADEHTTEKPPAEAPAEGEGEGDPLQSEKTEMHDKCCAVCKEALAKDKSKRKPEEIPCADFTVDLNPWCLEHFRDVPTKASECLGAAGPADAGTTP